MSDTKTPFLVIASLQQGVVLDTRIGVALDSLLSSEVRRKQKEEAGVSGKELDGGLSRLDNKIAPVNLPLAKCQDPNNLSNWHWMATCALPLDFSKQVIPSSSIDIHSIIQTQNVPEIEESVSKMPNIISEKSGRWRNKRVPIASTPAAYLAWSGVGDPNKVNTILQEVSSIGQRRQAGEGTVLSWKVTELESTPDEAGHLYPLVNEQPGQARQIGRPCYQNCLVRLDVSPDRVYVESAGMRPPYWHPSTQEEVLLPTDRGEV